MTSLLFIAAFLSIALTQILAGGRSPALSIPGYGLLALAAMMSWWPMRRTPIPRSAAGCLIGAALFFGYVVIRASFSPEEYLARKDLYVALGAFTLYLLVALNLTSPKTRLLFIGALLVLASANSIVGALQFFKGENFMVFDFLPRPDYGSRASGFFGYPNYLATFLTVTFLLGLSVTCWSQRRLAAKILSGYFSLVCLLGLLLTGSRGGYIGCAVGLVVFGALSLFIVRKSTGTRMAMIVAGLLATLAVGWAVQHFVSKSYVLHSRASTTLSVDISRAQLWRAGWQQFRLQPATGTGSGTYAYFGRQFRSPKMQNDPVNAHNEYLQLLAEYGILGLAVAIIFLETHFRRALTSFARATSSTSSRASLSSDGLALNVGAVSAATACLAHAYFDFTLHSPANLLLMAFVFGLLVQPGGALPPNAEASQPAGLPSYFRLALPTLGLWIGIRALPTWPAEYFAERARLLTSQSKHMTSPESAHEVESLAQRGIAWDSRNPELYFSLGLAHDALAAQSEDPAARKAFEAQSLTAYQKALALAPQDVRLVLSVAWASHGLSRFDDATPLFERAVQLDPNSGRVRYAYAAHLHTKGKLTEAENEYQRSLQLGGGPTAQAGFDRLREERKAQSLPGSNPAQNRPAP